MLFPLNPNTPTCNVFTVLNNELLHFLEASIQANEFSEMLFSHYQHNGQRCRSVCWTNSPTREKFRALWNALPICQQGKQELYDLINGSQDIQVYFNDLTIQLPTLGSEDLFEAFKTLTSYLFTDTIKRKSARDEANSNIHQHFQEYKRVNSDSQLCYLCGTALLSHDRSGLMDHTQWRGDYDHILCQDKYPIYSIHPGNFIPTCHICNSKAKGAKDVLRCDAGRRRTAFYPLPPSQESCYQYTSIEPTFRQLTELHDGEWQDPIAAASIMFTGASVDIAAKINVWKEVYQVPGRVENHVITHFCERIASDLMPRDFNDFCNQLTRYAQQIPLDLKKSEWRCWWYRVYESLTNLDQEQLRDVWSLIEWKLEAADQQNMRDSFGI
ncbi:hypothetical protein DFP75_10764 [Marinomonas alcarazii]|uniref:Uncharacterized protein n=1 Tax=Marinomonas alcarazii TaxID=491949 RepID=A0A318V7F5_9GAMM|nr:hypothetical protein [Marinomonas alcarazii]PYF79899.1 hypothetical protein DFP75_10764 [Marinomonas alcarazii]